PWPHRSRRLASPSRAARRRIIGAMSATESSKMAADYARVFRRCAPSGLGFALLLAAHCGGKVIIDLDPDRLEQACQSTCEALAGCYALGQEQCVSGCRGASSA